MKTKELKPSFLSCAEDLLTMGKITKETYNELILGIERDNRETYEKITYLLNELANSVNVKKLVDKKPQNV